MNDFELEPPTERAKVVLSTYNMITAPLTVITGVPQEELESAELFFKAKTLPAVMGMNWSKLIKAHIEHRVGLYKAKLAQLHEQYSTIQPFSSRKIWYEQNVVPANASILRLQRLLDYEPHITWTPSEVATLKRLGTKNYLWFCLERFYPQVQD